MFTAPGRYSLAIFLFPVVLFLLSSCYDSVQSDVYNVRGKVTLCSCGNDTVELTLVSGEYGTSETVTSTDGEYVFNNVWKGTYTVIPRKEGYTFSPASREVTVSDTGVDLNDFDTIASWEKRFGPADRNGEAFSVIQTPDCGYLIAGYRDVSVSGVENLDMWIVKTDLYGRVIWENTAGDVNYPDIAYSAIIDSGGNIVVGGYSDSADAGSINILKYVLSGSEGNSWTITGGWSNYYGTALLPEKSFYIFETMDSGYFAGGYSGGTAGNLEDIYGVKTGGSGEHLSTFSFGMEDAERSMSAEMIIRDPLYAGGLIMAGESRGSSGATKGLLLKRNSLYSDGWNREYTAKNPLTGGDSFFTSFNSVKEAGDGGYICGGTVKRNSSSTRDIYIIKTDINGNEEWGRLIDSGSDEFDCHVVLTGDGGYAAGFTCMSLTDKNYNFVIVKISSSGDIQWKREYDAGGDSDDFLRSLFYTYDGGYAIGGITTSFYGKRQVFIIKTDENGDLPFKIIK
ncbi:MAG TPA: carboxypeptidase-like regulatory domain-containing protein [Spirochaetota bacterium]|nr:carboxypeptidase-like regulatory domain-containing protein [Spirochaetota bacterium]HPJ36433.1 carboxypeptidase-like regulatory domain-containing protein [Spirochaetota bacterium]